MAIDAVVSNRNFGSFIGSGKVYQEQAAIYQRKDRLHCAAAQYVQGNISYKNLFGLTEPLFPKYRRYWYQNFIGSFNSEALRARAIFHDELDCPNVLHQKICNKFQNIKHRRRSGRTRGICECCLSSIPSHSNWIQPRNLGKFGIVDSQFQQSKHARTQVDYKSEEYDITGEGLDSLASPDGASEAILAEAKPWWELPKRWVIVLLCFTAFLLCNMDRVNMSIVLSSSLGQLSLCSKK